MSHKELITYSQYKAIYGYACRKVHDPICRDILEQRMAVPGLQDALRAIEDHAILHSDGTRTLVYAPNRRTLLTEAQMFLESETKCTDPLELTSLFPLYIIHVDDNDTRLLDINLVGFKDLTSRSKVERLYASTLRAGYSWLDYDTPWSDMTIKEVSDSISAKGAICVNRRGSLWKGIELF